jgi:putative transcriptional regulator
MVYKCKLKVILAEKEIKHGDFARKIELSPAALSSIVNNKALPSFETLYKMCEELSMKPQEIWVRENS